MLLLLFLTLASCNMKRYKKVQCSDIYTLDIDLIATLYNEYKSEGLYDQDINDEKVKQFLQLLRYFNNR